MKKRKRDFFNQLFTAILISYLCSLIFALDFLKYINITDFALAKLYLLGAFPSHFFLFSLVNLIICSICYLISNKKTITSILFVLLGSFNIIFIKLDTIVYSQFRFHISPFVLKMIFGRKPTDIYQFNTLSIIKATFFVIAIILLHILIWKITIKLNQFKPLKRIKKASLICFVFFLISSNIVFAWADASMYRPITQTKELFPFYFPLTAQSFFVNNKLVDATDIKKHKDLYKIHNSNLIKYPITPIKSNPTKEKRNFLFLIIDSWRYDCMDSIITPNIYKLSKKSQVFNNHHSGSNATSEGLFTLFYGISGLCYDSFTNHEISPVLIDELKKQNYNFNILGSATLENPPFDKNIFSGIDNLRLNSKSETPSARDIEITEEWLNKFQTKKPTPFFDFIFFDAAHGYDKPSNYPAKFEPYIESIDYTQLDNSYDSKKIKNSYKNSLHFIDYHIGRILTKIETENLLDDTVIIISSDHGQEFNDNNKGYWNHGGNYTKYQTQVPLIIFDSKKEAKSFNHLSLHYDIAPNLLTNYLGVSNKITDFSIGKDLYTNSNRTDFLCGFNNSYALVEKNKITRVLKNSGVFSITDHRLNELHNERLNYKKLDEILKDINKFYVKNNATRTKQLY